MKPNEALSRQLAEVRDQIDAIDARLLALLNQRAACAQRVGAIKAEHGEADVIAPSGKPRYCGAFGR